MWGGPAHDSSRRDDLLRLDRRRIGSPAAARGRDGERRESDSDHRPLPSVSVPTARDRVRRRTRSQAWCWRTRACRAESLSPSRQNVSTAEGFRSMADLRLPAAAARACTQTAGNRRPGRSRTPLQPTVLRQSPLPRFRSLRTESRRRGRASGRRRTARYFRRAAA